MQAERSLSELTRDLTAQAGELVRNEIRLVRAEAVEQMRAMAGGALRAALGVALAGAALTLALLAVAYALGEVLPIWAAALVSAAGGGSVAYWLIKNGLKSLSIDHVRLPRSAEQVSRDLKLLKENTPL